MTAPTEEVREEFRRTVESNVSRMVTEDGRFQIHETWVDYKLVRGIVYRDAYSGDVFILDVKVVP